MLTLLLVTVVLALAACGGTQAAPSASGTAPAAQVTPSAESTPAAPATPHDLELVESGWSMVHGCVEYGVVIRNPNADFAGDFVSIDVLMEGKGGQILGSDTQVIGMIYPGGTLAWGVQADPNGKKPAKVTFSLSVRDENWHPADSAEVVDSAYEPFKVSRTRVSTDSSGFPVVTGLLENPNSKPFGSIAVSALFKDAGGKIIAGYTGFVEDVPAGGKKAFEVNAFANMPEYKSVDVYAQSWDF
ncbi:MAG: FxLYD domain-containing protein [Actinobacteria bacterium]|nr:FxLYD domain-containing protein [Actinomycetota bacterium]